MRDLSIYHQRTRHGRVNRPLYWVARVILQPFFHVYFGLTRRGRPHVPAAGPVIIAANHRSFLDPFVIATLVRRPVYFVAKKELFTNRIIAWALNSLGAFPVCREESDEESVETARTVLERGDAVVIFPEGTRIRSGGVGHPKRGVGRLALETGAPVVPVAVVGSDRARRGWLIRPARVRLRAGRPLTFPRVPSPSANLAIEVTARIWPCVELQWEWLGGLPALRKAAVVGAGPMGSALAALLARAGLEVQLGCRTLDQVRLMDEPEACAGAGPATQTALAGSGVRVSTVGEIEFAGVDLVVFAVPSRGLPGAVGQVGASIGDRTAVLTVSKGLVPPLGARPSSYVAERVKARAIGFLGGPTHADEAVATGASVVLATTDDAFAGQLGEALEAAGLEVERTTDLVGTELAACAKNAAALAAAVAAARGMNAAGAVASRVFLEAHDFALKEGARTQTFLGIAGTGDLVGTALAAGSRNRRAGELLAQGASASGIPAALGATPEALDTVPLLARAYEERRLEAPATHALAELVEGRLAPETWLAGLQRPASGARSRRAA